MPNQIAFYPQSSGGGAGSVTLLSTTNVSVAAASVTISIPAGYTQYQLISNVVPATGNSDILCAQVSSDTTTAHYFIAGSFQPFSGTLGAINSFTSPGAIVGNGNGFSQCMIYAPAAGGGQFIGNGVGGGSLGVINFGSVYSGASIIAGTSLLLQICGPNGTATPPVAGINIAVGSYFKLYGIS